MKKNSTCCGATRFLLAFLALLSMTGCYGGSRGSMRFDDLSYPASMSAYLYGPNDELLIKGRELRVIKQFTHTETFPAVFYSLASSGAKDVSGPINKAIAEAGGEGIVNVRITAKTGATTFFHPLTLLPAWPSYTEVTIDGEIVQYEPQTAQGRPWPRAFALTGDMLILEMPNEAAAFQLREECSTTGRAESVLFYYDTMVRTPLSAVPWESMRSLETEGVPQTRGFRSRANRLEGSAEQDMRSYVMTKARERNANVVQILYMTLGGDDVKEKFREHQGEWFFFSPKRGAMDVVYWSCPPKVHSNP